MTGNTVISGMRPPLLSIMAASGALYSHASGSILPSRARMATPMLRTGGPLGNIGQMIGRLAQNRMPTNQVRPVAKG